MSPRTPKQFEEIRKEKRQLIMDTALDLFAYNGYETTSINQIAKKAGISKGLLYNYFEGKEELIEAILNKGIDDLMSFYDPNNNGEIDAAELEYFISESFKMVEKNRIFWKLYFSISVQPGVFKLIENRIDDLYKPVVAKLVKYFQKAGFKNPVLETILFSSLMDGVTFDYVFKPELFPLEPIKKEIIKRYCKQYEK